MAEESFVQVRDLRFDYGFAPVLDGVSIQVPQGSVTALVGPNGAGKTTLLRCIAGLERPLAGSVAVGGIDVVESPRRARRLLGFQQDYFGVYGALSVGRNLLHAAAIQDVADASAAARWAVQAVGLADRWDVLAGTLSRGQRQRLAIARAMIHRPRLLLMDEPASGLDPEARHDLSALITALRQDGMTIVVSSHILSELEEYSTHMLSLRDGKVLPLVSLDAATHQALLPWRLEIVGDQLQALSVLAALGVQARPEAAGTLHCLLAGQAKGRADLVSALVSAGLGVASLAPAGSHLEHLYLTERP